MKTQWCIQSLPIIFTFYKTHFWADMLITCACLWVLYTRGLVAFQGIFWLKILSAAVIYYFVNQLSKHEYYYYQNLGLSKTTLWATTLSLDFILYIAFIILTYHMR